MDLFNRLRVLADSKGSIGLRGVDRGRLKRMLLRTRVLPAGKGLRILGVLGCLEVTLLESVEGLLCAHVESEEGVIRTAAEVNVRDRIEFWVRKFDFGDAELNYVIYICCSNNGGDEIMNGFSTEGKEMLKFRRGRSGIGRPRDGRSAKLADDCT